MAAIGSAINGAFETVTSGVGNVVDGAESVFTRGTDVVASGFGEATDAVVSGATRGASAVTSGFGDATSAVAGNGAGGLSPSGSWKTAAAIFSMVGLSCLVNLL